MSIRSRMPGALEITHQPLRDPQVAPSRIQFLIIPNASSHLVLPSRKHRLLQAVCAVEVPELELHPGQIVASVENVGMAHAQRPFACFEDGFLQRPRTVEVPDLELHPGQSVQGSKQRRIVGLEILLPRGDD
jgi:hypothetical protein